MVIVGVKVELPGQTTSTMVTGKNSASYVRGNRCNTRCI